MTLNGFKIDWREEADLPDYCGVCPFWWAPNVYAPGVANHDTGGICMLRNMNKDRYADAPQACRRLFKKCLRYPEDSKLVITLKD